MHNMKKLILIGAVVFATGILSSCKKENASPVNTNNQFVTTSDRKDIGSAD